MVIYWLDDYSDVIYFALIDTTLLGRKLPVKKGSDNDDREDDDATGASPHGANLQRVLWRSGYLQTSRLTATAKKVELPEDEK